MLKLVAWSAVMFRLIPLFVILFRCASFHVIAAEAQKSKGDEAAKTDTPKKDPAPTSDKPTLKGAEVALHTSAGEKRIDTCLFITIESKDGKVLARVADAACSELKDQARLRYIKNSDHKLALDVPAWGEDRDACKGFTVKIWQEPAANTHVTAPWEFDAKITLKFADGTTLNADKASIRFVDRGDTATTSFSSSE